jgi:hypothetical protein
MLQFEYRILVGKLEGRNHMADIGIENKMLLKNVS